MSNSNKTCDEVVFFVRVHGSINTYNGKPIYKSWPKLPHTDSSSAKNWAGSKHFTVNMKNEFKNAKLVDEFDIRGYSSKIPQAAIYCEEKDCYLQFDYRTDGLVETLTTTTIGNGNIKCKMSFRFSGGNYYFVPTNGSSFKEFKKKFNSSPSKSPGTVKVEVGEIFHGNYDSCYVYLGKFECVRDDSSTDNNLPDYTGINVNVYLQVFSSNAFYDPNRPNIYFSVSKSKMKSKGTVDKSHPNYQDMINCYDQYKNMGDIVQTEYFDKANYGSLTNLTIDKFRKTLSFEDKRIKRTYCSMFQNFGGL